jgi:hypothetical protein
MDAMGGWHDAHSFGPSSRKRSGVELGAPSFHAALPATSSSSLSAQSCSSPGFHPFNQALSSPGTAPMVKRSRQFSTGPGADSTQASASAAAPSGFYPVLEHFARQQQASPGIPGEGWS